MSRCIYCHEVLQRLRQASPQLERNHVHVAARRLALMPTQPVNQFA